MKTRILITGGCGFIGHHFVEHILRHTDWEIVILDRLNYSGSVERLRDIKAFDENRVRLLTADFTLPIDQNLAKEIGNVQFIVHMGAETHVDNSIKDPAPFFFSNVIGTLRVLDFAREQLFRGFPVLKFIYFSTDEVFGPAPGNIAYFEGDRHNPGNPYAASKAGAEDLCTAYANTYKLPIMVTNTMNVFGERQHPEKFIPMVINRVLKGEKVIIHSNPEKTKAGSRFYIHARNVSDALLFLLRKGDDVLNIEFVSRGRFNIVGEREVDNLELAQLITKYVNEWFLEDTAVQRPLNYELVDFHSSRPGHDLRYALEGSKMKTIGWDLPVHFEDSLRRTVYWFLDPENKRWLEV